MRDRRKIDVVSWSRFFWCTLFVVLSCVIFTGFTFSTVFRLFFRETFHPVVVSSWRNPAMEAVVSGDSTAPPAVSVRETVLFPDQAVVFLKYPLSARLLTKEDIDCVYFSANSTKPKLRQPPIGVDSDDDSDEQIVRCQIPPRGFSTALAVKSDGRVISGPAKSWDWVAYEALIDCDNTTIVFVKGLNLRPEKLSDASRFECVYGWDFQTARFLIRSDVVSIAQEIVRCRTPLSVLAGLKREDCLAKVSVRIKGGRVILPSVAQPGRQPALGLPAGKAHEMCICTMVRNQARFLKEWVMYHSRIGVERWFIYDNNSEDDIVNTMHNLDNSGYNVTRHIWPWIKTQEAGFVHCALRARHACEWVGFIDVDEFFHLPSGLYLRDVLKNESRPENVAEFRVSCYSFGPSGLKKVPKQGVTVGYTCRVGAPERHKSIVRPEALNSSLINVVHHFHIKEGYDFMNMDRGVLVINHYKYQVWEVFKEKFYRRVATYVADWTKDQNAGSKDRAPGLGTRAVEPPDWSERFCEVNDTGLKDRVLQAYTDPQTQVLPWQVEER